MIYYLKSKAEVYVDKGKRYYFEIDLNHVYNNRIKIEMGKSVPMNSPGVGYPLEWFEPWEEAKDVWESL